MKLTLRALTSPARSSSLRATKQTQKRSFFNKNPEEKTNKKKRKKNQAFVLEKYYTGGEIGHVHGVFVVAHLRKEKNLAEEEEEEDKKP